MKHEGSHRCWERTPCYSGKHAVIQRPRTSGGKCLEGKSVFVNDMGQLFWGRLDLCTHLQASRVTPRWRFFIPECSALAEKFRFAVFALSNTILSWWKSVYTLFCMSNRWHCRWKRSHSTIWSDAQLDVCYFSPKRPRLYLIVHLAASLQYCAIDFRMHTCGV